jgi:hypothetical protein
VFVNFERADAWLLGCTLCVDRAAIGVAMALNPAA